MLGAGAQFVPFALPSTRREVSPRQKSLDRNLLSSHLLCHKVYFYSVLSNRGTEHNENCFTMKCLDSVSCSS